MKKDLDYTLLMIILLASVFIFAFSVIGALENMVFYCVLLGASSSIMIIILAYFEHEHES